jgi:hypothetical protein
LLTEGALSKVVVGSIDQVFIGMIGATFDSG